MMRIILFPLFMLLSYSIIAQTIDFKHCKCTEFSTENVYSVLRKGVEVESGQYVEGLRTGKWVSKNVHGTVVRSAHYWEGKLDGSYELFHFDGTPKLVAKFEKGIPAGSWVYYNAKGKVIKQGAFSEGKPVGVWSVYDPKGNELFTQYDYDTHTELFSLKKEMRYFQNDGLVQDGQSGEWMILFFPKRKIETETEPLGGHLLANDFFSYMFNIPPTFMDTYAKHRFTAKVKIENGIAHEIEVDLMEEEQQFDFTTHSFAFIVETNVKRKLTKVDHSPASIRFLKDQLAEYIAITGPWISEKEFDEILIQAPIVLNEG